MFVCLLESGFRNEAVAEAEELPRWNTLHYFKWGDGSAGAPLRPRVEESTGEWGFHQFPVGCWWGWRNESFGAALPIVEASRTLPRPLGGMFGCLL